MDQHSFGVRIGNFVVQEVKQSSRGEADKETMGTSALG